MIELMDQPMKARFLDFIFKYNSGQISINEVEPITDRLIFMPFAQQFDRDNEKWAKTKERRSASGKLGVVAKAAKKAKKASGPKVDPEAKAKSDELLEIAWSLYQRKGAKAIAREYWAKLSPEDHASIIARIPMYLKDKPEVKYRKEFQGWINPKNRLWENKTIDELSQDAHVPVILGNPPEWAQSNGTGK
jgi:hypothetical protein